MMLYGFSYGMAPDQQKSKIKVNNITKTATSFKKLKPSYTFIPGSAHP